VRRAGLDTPQVARLLARSAGVPWDAVGYAGLKDRDAVAEQRFTVVRGRRLRELPEGLKLVASGQTRDPLQPGDLEGNRFRIVVRGGDPDVARTRLARLACFPNRYGPQRTANGLPELGLDVLLGRQAPADPQRRRFALLAWQAALFNRVLDLRADERFNGDVVEDGERTGPLFGARMRWPRGAALAFEEGVLAESGVGLDELEAVARILPGGRRPLFARAHDARIEPHPAGFVLHVTLAAGVYATSLLHELL
jgi:tRNA pseudouridine13 synthase